MPVVKKIAVHKNEEPSSVAEKIIDVSADHIVLVIPKFSKLAESSAHFHLLKREAEALHKQISVESVDDRVIEFCKKHAIDCVNPFFGRPSRQFSDIVRAKRETVKEKNRSQEEGSPDVSENVPVETPHRPKRGTRLLAASRSAVLRSVGWCRLVRRSKARVALLAGVLVFFSGGVVAVVALPKAAVTIIAATVEVPFQGVVAVERSAKEIDDARGVLPGQIFSEEHNLQVLFPATGTRNVARKAAGTITIYNSYSSDSQPLVATTRFAAPDGKIFRLVRSVTVPGARIADGKIVPSQIDAAVVADEPGPAYNIGPVAKFTVPGFQGTPKFSGFFAMSKEAMKGGFVGEVRFPTPQDIAAAKEKFSAQLRDASTLLLLAKIPKHFKLLEEATRFRLLTQTIKEEANEQGEFMISGSGELSMFAFSEEDVRMFLLARAKREIGPDIGRKKGTLSYRNVAPDFEKGRLLFTLEATTTFARVLDPEVMRERIMGQTERDLREVFRDTPGIARIQVSLWPFWVRRVPGRSERVTITVE